MIKDIDTTAVKEQPLDAWLDDVDADLPEEISASRNHANFTNKLKKKKIALQIHDLTTGKAVKFKAQLDDTLGEAFAKGATSLGNPLLPPSPQKPLDVLRYRKRGKWSEPLTNLDQPLILAIILHGTRHFGIEYKLVVKINAQWNIAPTANATPRELLAAFGMDADKFSLYETTGIDPLPPDTPLSLVRGMKFEAHADGKYGEDTATEPNRKTRRGSQTIEENVEELKETGVDVRLHSSGGQKYVEIRGVKIPSPPWGKAETSILIAVPATYPSGGLDALYIELPLPHSSGSIPYQQSTMQFDERSWILISWHYHESRPWNPLYDDLSTHLEHCRGYFLTRGVRQ